MMCDIFEIGLAIGATANAFSVILDAEKVAAPFLPTYESDVLGPGVDAVLHEFSNSFERIALRQGDDLDGFPVVADAQFSSVLFHSMQNRDTASARFAN